MKNILVTGYNGFLMREFRNSDLYKNYNFIEYKYRAENAPELNYIKELKKLNLNEIWHFGSPSNSNEIKSSKLFLKGTLNMIKLSNIFNIPLIYASSQAVIYDNTLYAKLKRKSEKIIQKNFKNCNDCKDYTDCKNFKILRIPRVYSKNKTKGLFDKLINNLVPKEDMKKEIKYYDIKDFLLITKSFLEDDKEDQKNKIFEYSDEFCKKNSIFQISKIYIKKS